MAGNTLGHGYRDKGRKVCADGKQLDEKASRLRPWRTIDTSRGRPPRYALTCRYGRPGKPTSQSEVVRGPAKRDLYTIVTSLYDALKIWLAFKRTTFNVCAFCMAARAVAALIMSGAFFFVSGII